MGPTGSDAEVIAESVAVPARFGVLYERHLRRVAQYLSRRVGHECAEDLAAEVFVRAFRARARFRADHESALPWLLGIASHLVADHRRAERQRLTAVQQVMAATPPATEDEVALLASTVVERLRELPAGDRDALLLVVWGELSYQEAASALGIPVGTIRSRIARARERLARDLAEPPPQFGKSGRPEAMPEGDRNV